MAVVVLPRTGLNKLVTTTVDCKYVLDIFPLSYLLKYEQVNTSRTVLPRCRFRSTCG